MYGRSFYSQTFSLFISLYTCLNLSTSFYCPDFAMQKSWSWPSLFYDFGEVSVNHFVLFIVAKCNGCVPSCLLNLYFSVTSLSEAWWIVHQKFCTLCVAWCSRALHNKPHWPHCFSFGALSCSSQPHVVYFLLLPPHAFHWNAITATWFHIFVQSPVALCQLSSAVLSIYKVDGG